MRLPGAHGLGKLFDRGFKDLAKAAIPAGGGGLGYGGLYALAEDKVQVQAKDASGNPIAGAKTPLLNTVGKQIGALAVLGAVGSVVANAFSARAADGVLGAAAGLIGYRVYGLAKQAMASSAAPAAPAASSTGTQGIRVNPKLPGLGDVKVLGPRSSSRANAGRFVGTTSGGY